MTKHNQVLLRQKTKMTKHKKSKYKCDKMQKEKNTNMKKCKRIKYKCDKIQNKVLQISQNYYVISIIY